MEHWVEINLNAEVAMADGILLDVLSPYVRRLLKTGGLVTYHYFREPEIRFRVRMKTAAGKRSQEASLARIADSLVKKGVVREWHFGNHGEKGRMYAGEEDRYGRNGWRVAQRYFRDSADTALALLELRREGRLESPLWGKGLGNPWEGGDRNPWRGEGADPLSFHWSRFVHLLTNQLGFDMKEEAELCERQALRYREAVKEFGMKW